MGKKCIAHFRQLTSQRWRLRHWLSSSAFNINSSSSFLASVCLTFWAWIVLNYTDTQTCTHILFILKYKNLIIWIASATAAARREVKHNRTQETEKKWKMKKKRKQSDEQQQHSNFSFCWRRPSASTQTFLLLKIFFSSFRVHHLLLSNKSVTENACKQADREERRKQKKANLPAES